METTDTNQEPKSSSILYISIILLLMSLCYIAYLYLSYEIIKKDQLKEKYVLKNNINFDMLPSYEKSNYVDSYKYTNQITNLKKQIQQIQKNNISTNNIRTIEVEKIVKVPVEKIVEVEKIIKVPVDRIVEVEKNVTIPFDTKDETQILKEIETTNLTFNTYTCKNMKSGSIQISQKCKNDLYSFLKRNKDSKVFEVIGMIDNKDFKLLNKLKDVYGEKKIRHLSKYSQIGLSRQRVIEASWLMKKYLGDYNNIKTVNYKINAKDKKGFIVRAYK